MRRMFQRTQMETCASDSTFMDDIEKGLVAQIDIVRNADGHDTIVEHWLTQADKDADLAETLEQEKAETPRWPELEAYLRNLASAANPAKAPEAAEEPETARELAANPPPGHAPVIVFVRGPQNFWGFVAKMEDNGSYTLCTNPTMAWDFGTPDRAYAATEKMRAYETENHNWDQDYFVLAHERTLKAVRHMPEQAPGRIAFLHRATVASSAAGKGNG